MLSYKYVARDPKSGDKITGEIKAENEKSASKMLSLQGLAPLELVVAGQGGNLIDKYKNRIPMKEKILFARQLATLINAGLPLVQSLRSVGSQTTNKPLKVVINQLITDIEGGSAFSVALDKRKDVFSPIFVNLVAAGEVSGTLDAALERLATQQEKDAEILSKVKGAMVYPVIVLLVMVAVIGFMIVKVLPQVEVLYDGISGATLPLVTRILLAISHFVIDFWWVVILVIGVLTFMSSRWIKTLAGRRFADKLKMRAWPVGPLFMKLYMARFARTGTTLVASGVPLLQVLEITSNSINNYHIEQSLKVASEKIKGGKALSEAIANDPNFLELVPNMLRIGEQSGSLEQMMDKIAEYYEKEVDNQIKTISTIIEPVMMVVLGVVAFIIVAAVLLPVYSLAGKNIIK